MVIGFGDYCLWVLAGEVRQKEFDGTARRARCIAIKTYTWHFMIIPKEPERSGHLTTKQQSYQPGKVNENLNIYGDYDAVCDRWMESSEGYIFEASYKAGEKGKAGTKHGGELKQWGSVYLAGQGYKWNEILHYYYDCSGVSGDGVRIFNNQKCIIYK